MEASADQNVNLTRWLLGIFATVLMAIGVGVISTGAQIIDSLGDIKVEQARSSTQIEGLIKSLDDNHKRIWQLEHVQN